MRLHLVLEPGPLQTRNLSSHAQIFNQRFWPA